jgi:hypothetical protein
MVWTDNRPDGARHPDLLKALVKACDILGAERAN